MQTLLFNVMDLADRLTHPAASWIRPLLNEEAHYTLLAVCPVSEAVLQAAVAAAADAQAPLFLAATRNQVDVDGGYTRWTPASLVDRVEALRDAYAPVPPIVCGVDHGGPWCKDQERERRASWDEAQAGTQATLQAALDAGYRYVHIDTTLDPHRSGPTPVPVMVERAHALMTWTEAYRTSEGYPSVMYEVGVEEVAPASIETHQKRLHRFLTQLYDALPDTLRPAFVVSDVGTSFGTEQFDATQAQRTVAQARSFDALVKAHYSDFVTDWSAYPRCSIGGANIGPGLSAVEYEALSELETLARKIGKSPAWHDTLRDTLVKSNRWRKWVPEVDTFGDLDSEQQETLLKTGSRYVWADSSVQEARQHLYTQVAAYRDAEAYVHWRLRTAVLDMMHAFNLVGRAPHPA